MSQIIETTVSIPAPTSGAQSQVTVVPVRYRNQVFPMGIHPQLSEVPAHFDVDKFEVSGPYSLHTEYSSKTRKFSSSALKGLGALTASHRSGVPELWTSEAWALEFAEFVFRLVGEAGAPAVVEVHPPFSSRVSTFSAFLGIYRVFEETLLTRFPDCQIVIENRGGTKHSSRFLLSRAESIHGLGQVLASSNLKLGIALDLPQMFTAHFGSRHLVGMEGAELCERLMPVRDQIYSLHLWGRGPKGGAHCGDLNSLFDPSTEGKGACLSVLKEMFKHGRQRNLVIETLSKRGAIESILEDLQQAGIEICKTGCNEPHF